jgi:hypothetical protein
LDSRRGLELLRLTQVHSRHTESLSKATGQHYNIFRILRVGHREVTTHSPMLADLLDPKGTHGQGSAFLRLFLKLLPPCALDPDTAKVRLEYYAGPKTPTKGGKIDILLSSGRGEIVIENKIHAADQENQIRRYLGSFPRAIAVFLTLDGRPPSDLSAEEEARVQCLSYPKDILEWLLQCRKEAACCPGVRETLSHYIHLIEQLTGQDAATHMNQDLIQAIVESPESLRAFHTLRSQENAVQAAILKALEAKLKVVGQSENLAWSGLGEGKNWWDKEAYFTFDSPELSAANIAICFEFESSGFRDLCFGYCWKDPSSAGSIQEPLRKVCKSYIDPLLDAPSWPAYSPWGDYRNLGYQQILEAFHDGRFAGDVKEKICQLREIAEQAMDLQRGAQNQIAEAFV